MAVGESIEFTMVCATTGVPMRRSAPCRDGLRCAAMSEPTFSHDDSIEIAAPPEAVYDYLADFTHADVVLLARSGSDAAVVAQAQPNPVPSLYAQPISAASFCSPSND